ncbi:ABC transporter permease [Paucibacter sp. APW11]|uniref:Transport permease protein n=1 Tax=Roseateles aquae TaxID=3077235 RepID=A0ABU3PD77_9BURK|nr:ABC transporter permease [Paucibacter sp. APW11]MDT8999851.1 ABC transporter permease [Paucibacter sp. APW11]
MNAALKAYFVLDFNLVFRERMVLFFTFLLPAFMYAFFGMMFGDASYGGGAVSFYDEYTASFIGLILLNVALMNVGPVLVIYKEMGFFRRLLVTPLDMSAVWLSAITRSFVIFMIGFVEMVIVGWLMFHQLPQTSLVELFTAILVSAFSLFSFGFMLGAFFKSSNAAFNAGIFIFQPMLLLSGASIPLDRFPPFVTQLAQVVPMTHVVDVLRLAWRGEYFSPAGLTPTVLLLLLGTACALVARRAFRWSSM